MLRRGALGFKRSRRSEEKRKKNGNKTKPKVKLYRKREEQRAAMKLCHNKPLIYHECETKREKQSIKNRQYPSVGGLFYSYTIDTRHTLTQTYTQTFHSLN